MKIQVLAEGNTREQRARGEWGLSLLINEELLFDTFGHPEILEKNIKEYGVDLRMVKKVVISHNHWDHVSGLKYVLMHAKRPAVFLPQEDHRLYEFCSSYGAAASVSDEKGGDKNGIVLTGAMKACVKGDCFMEQGLIIEGKKGPVLIAGCSHPGILKMARRVKKLLKKPLYAVIGGMHLKDAPLKRIQKTAAALKKSGVKKIIAGHCTGDAACKALKARFGGNFKKIKQGGIYNI